MAIGVANGGSGNEFTTKRCVAVVYDCTGTVTDSAGALNTAAGTHGMGVFIPANSVVTNVFLRVDTALAGAGNLGCFIAAAGDVVASATAISGAPWSTTGIKGQLIATPLIGSGAAVLDAGTVAILKDRIASSFLLVGTSAVEVKFINSGTLTGGKVTMFVEYVVG